MQLHEARLLAAAARHGEQAGQVLACDALLVPDLDLESRHPVRELLRLGGEVARRGDRRGLVHQVAHAQHMRHHRLDAPQSGAGRGGRWDRIADEQEAVDPPAVGALRLVAVEAIAGEQEPFRSRRDHLGVAGGPAEVDRHPAGTLPLGFAAGPRPEPAPHVAARRSASEPHQRDRSVPCPVGLMHQGVVGSPAEGDRGRAPPEDPRQGAVETLERASDLALGGGEDEQVGGGHVGPAAPELEGDHALKVFLAR